MSDFVKVGDEFVNLDLVTNVCVCEGDKAYVNVWFVDETVLKFVGDEMQALVLELLARLDADE